MMTTDHAPCREHEADLKSQCLTLAEGLHAVILESMDPDSIRLALSTLQGTETGRDYLAANPLGR